jgi:cytochrome P450
MVALPSESEHGIPRAWRIPVVGNTLAMAKDPARFFVDCYRKYGPVFRISVLGRTHTVIAGAEAANFMGTREGRESLRSKEFWQGLVDEYGGTRTILGEDGEMHARLRAVMKRGYSRESLKGRYDDFIAITDASIAQNWIPGHRAPVVRAMQYMVTEQLGLILTGFSPIEYLHDIHTTTLHILNVLVTRQRPKILLRNPRYRRAKRRVFALGRALVAKYHSTKGQDGRRRDFVDDVMEAHEREPDLIPANDLILTLTGPYVAGLDTVANSVAACIYAVLKHPAALARIQREVDDYFAKGDVCEETLRELPATNGAIMEAMRLYPIAVAQMRTAARDFRFCGHPISEGEILFVATSVPHFMAEYFPHPDRFDIDRYERPRAEHLKPGVYSPYGRGPHTCLGKSLAEVQMLLTVARLFHKLDLVLEPADYVLKTKTAPTPGPAMNFKVRVKRARN